MTMINLIPAEIANARAGRAALRAWGLRLACALAVLVLAHAGLARLAAGKGREYRLLDNQCSVLKGELRSAESLFSQREALQARCDAIGAIRLRQPTGALLRLLARALTPTSSLTYLSIERCPPLPSPADARAGECAGQVRMRGRAAGHSDVGEIIRGLEESRQFASVALIGIHEPPPPDDPEAPRRPGVEFEVLCGLGSD